MITNFIIFILFVGVMLCIVAIVNKNKPTIDLSVYKKKQYLFDTPSEFTLYKMLLELFGDKYFIFPQVNYSHLIEPKSIDWKENRSYRSRIDRKSADFVFCDKERIVPMLVIELDGNVHDFKSKQARDQFIDEIAKIADLPILHIRTGDANREFVKREIESKLRLS